VRIRRPRPARAVANRDRRLAPEAFLGSLTEPQADLARHELASVIAELRRSGLDYQLAKACRLRRVVLTAAEAFVEVEQ